MHLLLKIGTFLVTAGLASCATVTTKEAPPPTKPISWQERETTLSRLQSWQLNGKIAVRTSQDSGSASVDWAQNRRSYLISLMGPLGSNSLKLQGSPAEVTLTTSDGKRYTAANPEELLAKRWGYNVPVSHLKYWIRGLTAPGIPAQTQFDQANRLSSLRQDGWYVEFPSYTRSGNVDLPSKVFITSSSLNVKIIIYKWSV